MIAVIGNVKYDEKTLMQMRLIEIEKRLKDVEVKHEHLNEIRRVQIIALAEDVESRIKTLEDARTRQIELNKMLTEQDKDMLELFKVEQVKQRKLKPSFWDKLFK